MRRTKLVPELFLPAPAKRAGRSARGSAEDNPALQAIWDAVCRIPPGEVETYGSVARAAGLPGRARQAGYALRVAPEGMNLPWHRVVGAGGRIVFPKSSRHYKEQMRRLRADGVTVVDGRVQRFEDLSIRAPRGSNRIR
jgi:methylated-DNA-protein-cysteine methyltransferase-like protein